MFAKILRTSLGRPLRRASVLSSCVGEGRVSRQAAVNAYKPFSRSFATADEASVHHLRTLDEYKEFLNKEKGILYFGAKWCGPCKRMGPLYSQLSQEHKTIAFGHIDIDENEDAAVEAKITSVPTFMVYKDGTRIQQFVGADPTQLEGGIAKLES